VTVRGDDIADRMREDRLIEIWNVVRAAAPEGRHARRMAGFPT